MLQREPCFLPRWLALVTHASFGHCSRLANTPALCSSSLSIKRSSGSRPPRFDARVAEARGAMNYESDTTVTSDSDTGEGTGATLVPLRLLRKDGGYACRNSFLGAFTHPRYLCAGRYFHLVLPMHPVRDRSADRSSSGPVGRSLIGAVPRAIGPENSGGRGPSGDRGGAHSPPGPLSDLDEANETDEDNRSRAPINKTSESLSKLLAEAFSSITSHTSPASRVGDSNAKKCDDDEDDQQLHTPLPLEQAASSHEALSTLSGETRAAVPLPGASMAATAPSTSVQAQASPVVEKNSADVAAAASAPAAKEPNTSSHGASVVDDHAASPPSAGGEIATVERAARANAEIAHSAFQEVAAKSAAIPLPSSSRNVERQRTARLPPSAVQSCRGNRFGVLNAPPHGHSAPPMASDLEETESRDDDKQNTLARKLYPGASAPVQRTAESRRDDRRLRESAAARCNLPSHSDEMHREMHREAEAARRLQHGRHREQQAQELAKEALLGFFPVALMKWPSTHQADGADVPLESTDDGRCGTQRKHSKRPTDTDSDTAAAESCSTAAMNLPAWPVPVAEAVAAMPGGGALVEADADADDVQEAKAEASGVAECEGTPDGDADSSDDAQGLLHMQLLKSYFVSRNPADFSPLATLIHVPAPKDLKLKPIATLLATGIDVDVGGACGWSPLSLALLGGDANLPCVRMLIEANANIELSPACRKGTTALLLAAANRQEACVRLLVAAQASLNSCDSAGKQPLVHCAAWQPDVRALRACALLLDKRADLSLRTHAGQLAAYASAVDAGNPKTAAMLLERAHAAQERAALELVGDDALRAQLK